MNGYDALTVVLSAATIAYFAWSHRRHVRWLQEGDRLTRQFDRLMAEREQYIDPIVVTGQRGATKQALKSIIEAWFARMDEHTDQRKRHFDDWRII